jgi:hypothetical protein
MSGNARACELESLREDLARAGYIAESSLAAAHHRARNRPRVALAGQDRPRMNSFRLRR